MLPIAPEKVRRKARLQPGRMFLIDIEKGRIVEDDEIKVEISRRRPYRTWLAQNLVTFDRLPRPAAEPAPETRPLPIRQQVFGYSEEDPRIILAPMACSAKEPIGSMGDDIPPAILSKRNRPGRGYLSHGPIGAAGQGVLRSSPAMTQPHRLHANCHFMNAAALYLGFFSNGFVA